MHKQMEDFDVGKTGSLWRVLVADHVVDPKVIQVIVEDDLKSLDYLPLWTHISMSPKFIRAQLHLQLSANEYMRQSGSAHPTTAAIIGIIDAFYTKDPEHQAFYPHLFQWDKPDGSGVYYIFAGLEIAMMARIYTTSELLRFRGSSHISLKLADTIKRNSDLAPICVKQNQVDQNGKPANMGRPKKPMKEDTVSTTDSDDFVVFGGKKQPALTPAGSSTSVKMNRGMNFNDGSNKSWKGARSEDGFKKNQTVQPIQPPEPGSQKNEGFQRFYQAVRSPSTMRVTAGGKIVPNNRGSSSPTAKWDKAAMTARKLMDKTTANENMIVESFKKGQGASSDIGAPTAAEGASTSQQQSSANVTTTGSNPMNTTLAPWAIPPGMQLTMHPTVHPGYHSHCMYPHVSMPVGLPMGPSCFSNPYGVVSAPYGMANLSYHGMQPGAQLQTASTNSVSQNQAQDYKSVDNASKSSGSTSSKKHRPAPIQISPPEQFDQNRPFVYNGQLMYTPQMPMSGMPVTAGSLNFPAGGSVTMSATTPAASVTQPMSAPLLTSGSQVGTPFPVGSMQPCQSGASSVVHLSAPARPPVTSIRASEITKSQLASLRAQLKHCEDQLQYNKHQIDEKVVEDQIKTVREYIAQFERTYQTQISFESTYNPVEPVKTPVRENSSTDTADEAASQTYSIRSPRHVKSSLVMKQSDQSQAISQAMLLALEKSHAGGQSGKGIAAAPSLEKVENRPNKGKYQIQSIIKAASDAPYLSAAKTLGPNQRQLFPFDNTKQAQQHPAYSGGYRATPYLVGQPAHDMRGRNFKATDYVYTRELTDEEKRARHVYWGQIPNKGFGLPKYDGKDFYPPSPVKSNGPASFGKPNMEKRSEIDVNFKFPAKVDSDPFHSSTATHHGAATKGGSVRSLKAPRLSCAVPIIDPHTMTRIDDDMAKTTTNVDFQSAQGSKNESEDETTPKAETRANVMSHNSGNETMPLKWQTLIKKGASGAAVPSTGAVTSTTATGFLPQYAGHAAASLSPSMGHPNLGITRGHGSDRGTVKLTQRVSNLTMEPTTDKTGENCPPPESASGSVTPATPTPQVDSLHQRYLRDAERLGLGRVGR